MRDNLFFGTSEYATLAGLTYEKLLSRKWITYTDVMLASMSKSEREDFVSISKSETYGELRKAFPDVCRAIKEKCGEDCIVVDGNNRSRRFRYVGNDNDPLSEMRNAKVVNNLKQYWQFCQDSAGFFPTSWLEHFFKGYKDLLNIKTRKQKGEQVLTSSIDRILKNIELLPKLYEAIIHKQVLVFEYKPYSEDTKQLIFHPHHLKEYNGRWHLLGHAEGCSPENGYNIALDRIEGKVRFNSMIKYISAPTGFYASFFYDIVGVSHLPSMQVQKICVRAHKYVIYKLTETKPIHHSQVITKPYAQYCDGEYGEFELYVEPNNEFIGRILQMGEGLEIVSPSCVREQFRDKISKMNDMYM